MTSMLPRPVRAVLFDVDGTLYAQPPLRAAMALEMALCALAPRRRADVRRVLAFRRLRETLRAGANGEPLARRQYTVVSEHLDCPPAEVEAAVEEWMHRRPMKWLRLCRRPGLTALLDFLRSRRITCGIFSDYPAHEKLSALAVADRFDLVLSAEDPEIGAFKPDPRGFVEAARRWNLAPSEVLYVGDRADVDAAGARAAGMPCALLTRTRRAGEAGVIPVRDLEELKRVIGRSL